MLGGASQAGVAGEVVKQAAFIEQA